MIKKINKPDISIVIGTYNRLPFLKLTINSIREEMLDVEAEYEIIIVDGGSTDGTIKWLANQKDIITLIQHNRGIWNGRPLKRRSWGYFMNLSFKCAQGKYVCMLSDDCLIVPGAIKNGYKFFEQKLSEGEKIGSLAFYWRNWPEEKKYFVLKVFKKIFVNHGMYLKKALEEVDYIDEETFLFYNADADLCLKMWQKGYKCIGAPDSYIEHYNHVNLSVRKTNSEKEGIDLENFLKKWGDCYGETLPERADRDEKEFIDNTDGASKFKYIDITGYYYKIYISVFIRKHIENLKKNKNKFPLLLNIYRAFKKILNKS